MISERDQLAEVFPGGVDVYGGEELRDIVRGNQGQNDASNSGSLLAEVADREAQLIESDAKMIEVFLNNGLDHQYKQNAKWLGPNRLDISSVGEIPMPSYADILAAVPQEDLPFLRGRVTGLVVTPKLPLARFEDIFADYQSDQQIRESDNEYLAISRMVGPDYDFFEPKGGWDVALVLQDEKLISQYNYAAGINELLDRYPDDVDAGTKDNIRYMMPNEYMMYRLNSYLGRGVPNVRGEEVQFFPQFYDAGVMVAAVGKISYLTFLTASELADDHTDRKGVRLVYGLKGDW